MGNLFNTFPEAQAKQRDKFIALTTPKLSKLSALTKTLNAENLMVFVQAARQFRQELVEAYLTARKEGEYDSFTPVTPDDLEALGQLYQLIRPSNPFDLTETQAALLNDFKEDAESAAMAIDMSALNTKSEETIASYRETINLLRHVFTVPAVPTNDTHGRFYPMLTELGADTFARGLHSQLSILNKMTQHAWALLSKRVEEPRPTLHKTIDYWLQQHQDNLKEPKPTRNALNKTIRTLFKYWLRRRRPRASDITRLLRYQRILHKTLGKKKPSQHADRLWRKSLYANAHITAKMLLADITPKPKKNRTPWFQRAKIKREADLELMKLDETSNFSLDSCKPELEALQALTQSYHNRKHPCDLLALNKAIDAVVEKISQGLIKDYRFHSPFDENSPNPELEKTYKELLKAVGRDSNLPTIISASGQHRNYVTGLFKDKIESLENYFQKNNKMSLPPFSNLAKHIHETLPNISITKEHISGNPILAQLVCHVLIEQNAKPSDGMVKAFKKVYSSLDSESDKNQFIGSSLDTISDRRRRETSSSNKLTPLVQWLFEQSAQLEPNRLFTLASIMTLGDLTSASTLDACCQAMRDFSERENKPNFHALFNGLNKKIEDGIKADTLSEEAGQQLSGRLGALIKDTPGLAAYYSEKKITPPFSASQPERPASTSFGSS